jgi:predicted nucleotidyltransferase
MQKQKTSDKPKLIDEKPKAHKTIKDKIKKSLKKPKKNKKPAHEKPVKKTTKISTQKFPSLKLKSERDIAMDFAEKAYQRFDKLIKSIILFGSQTKGQGTSDSDIDIVLIVDDATTRFDETLIAWYREELGKLIQSNPYKQDLHINTIKLTTWWQDLTRGDPTIINIIRYGETLIDFGGFFKPLKILLQEGKIKTSPEATFTCLNRVPGHIIRSRLAEISAIEGCYWAMVDSAQALLMAVKVLPPSPEKVPLLLKQHFVDRKLLKMNYVSDLSELHELHKQIIHGEINNLDGATIDSWQEKSDNFFKVVLELIDNII